MGNTAIVLLCAAAAIKLGRPVICALANVLLERARRATLVAVLSIAREGAASSVVVHHGSEGCDVHIASVPTIIVTPERLTSE